MSSSRVRNRFVSDGVDEYLKRIRPYARLELVDASRKKKKLPARKGEGELRVALDVGGDQLSSEELAKILADNDYVSFHIGGPDGLDRSLKGECDLLLSMSKMTFTGELSQLLLLEQIYRALTIINSHPYHK